MPISIGPITIDEPVFLAPMSGVSDLPYRRLVKRFGAGLVFSEMLASRPLVELARKNRNIPPRERLDYTEEFPIAVQIAGCEPDVVAEAARICADRGAHIIDLNFGCPVKKVVNGMGGSALMRDEPLALRIIEAAVKAVPVPVTVKMRLGWDFDCLNAPVLAKAAEDLGAEMITVHGRTRNQLYNGAADWEAVRAVRDAISLPLIVNGDIISADAARDAFQKSGADGVMVGRGSYGKPWAVRQIMDELAGRPITSPPRGAALCDLILEHYDLLLDYYGIENGVRIARKHIGWYLDGFDDAEDVRRAVNTSSDPKDVKDLICGYFRKNCDAIAA